VADVIADRGDHAGTPTTLDRLARSVAGVREPVAAGGCV
jgi:hypothetical protein